MSSPSPVGVLLFMHTPLAEAFVSVLTHVMGGKQEHLQGISVQTGDDVARLGQALTVAIAQLDTGAGVLIVTDICGATPYQIAQRHLVPDRVALLCGASLPMLVRALTYRHDGLNACIAKALSGAGEGIFSTDCNAEDSQNAAS